MPINSHGYSLVELMLASGLLVGVGFLIATLNNDQAVLSRAIEQKFTASDFATDVKNVMMDDAYCGCNLAGAKFPISAVEPDVPLPSLKRTCAAPAGSLAVPDQFLGSGVSIDQIRLEKLKPLVAGSADYLTRLSVSLKGPLKGMRNVETSLVVATEVDSVDPSQRVITGCQATATGTPGGGPPPAYADCTGTPWGTIPHGETRDGFGECRAPVTVSCSNGVLDNPSATVAPGACDPECRYSCDMMVCNAASGPPCQSYGFGCFGYPVVGCRWGVQIGTPFNAGATGSGYEWPSGSGMSYSWSTKLGCNPSCP